MVDWGDNPVAVRHCEYDVGRKSRDDAQIAQIDVWLESWNAALPPLMELIPPGGTRAAASTHACRCAKRGAGRCVAALSEAVVWLRFAPALGA
jgi:cob(I)alamin adenosyltransferase